MVCDFSNGKFQTICHLAFAICLLNSLFLSARWSTICLLRYLALPCKKLTTVRTTSSSALAV